MASEPIAPEASVRLRHYVMVRPTYFDVSYAINPWMDPTRPVDRALAMRQWEALVESLESLGHVVDVLEGRPGLPDMVFAANAGVSIDGRTVLARFAHPERQGEEAAFREWFVGQGDEVLQAQTSFEGSGDVLHVPGAPGEPSRLIANVGPRTTEASHREVEAFFGTEVVSVTIDDLRYYHLDTALSVLDRRVALVRTEAFSKPSLQALEGIFDELVPVSDHDAGLLGANVISTGTHVLVDVEAEGVARAVEDRGFVAVPVAMGEFRKSGGGPHCCVLERIRAPERAIAR